MTEKDLEKIKVMQQLPEKQITQEQAAKVLNISDRRVRNIFKRYKELGDQGVISKKIVRASNNHLSEDLKHRALKIIAATYSDFGPTLAQEKLKENHGITISVESIRITISVESIRITISVESIRRLIIKRNLWIPKGAPDPVVHRLRPRRPFFGELMQADGSKHRRFEDRGPECTLLVLIDDATGSTARLPFVPTETLEGYFEPVQRALYRNGLASCYINR